MKTTYKTWFKFVHHQRHFPHLGRFLSVSLIKQKS